MSKTYHYLVDNVLYNRLSDLKYAVKEKGEWDCGLSSGLGVGHPPSCFLASHPSAKNAEGWRTLTYFIRRKAGPAADYSSAFA